LPSPQTFAQLGALFVNSGDWIIAWSIRLALLLLVVVQAFQLESLGIDRLAKAIRWLWTIAFLFFSLHVAAAFHFVHRWSHRAAFDATAKETLDKMGFAYGTGVYFNYLFLLVWAIDLIWVWRPETLRNRTQQVLFYAGRAYLLFIAFNGTVVFKTGWMRILGISATALLAALLWRCLQRTKIN